MAIPKWSEITREEKYFTAVFFQELTADPLPFWKLIRQHINCSDDVEIVDVGYEVCMLRDLAHTNHVQRKPDFEKQTFDLVLTLSNNAIVIIEAKAHQSFSRIQINNMKKSAEILLKNQDLGIESIYIAGLHSSIYNPKNIKSEYPNMILKTWSDIAKIYPNKKSDFLRANEIYNN